MPRSPVAGTISRVAALNLPIMRESAVVAALVATCLMVVAHVDAGTRRATDWPDQLQARRNPGVRSTPPSTIGMGAPP